MFLKFKGAEDIASFLTDGDLSDYLARRSSTALNCSSQQDKQWMKDVTETHHRDLYFLPRLLKKNKSPQLISDVLSTLITSITRLTKSPFQST